MGLFGEDVGHHVVNTIEGGGAVYNPFGGHYGAEGEAALYSIHDMMADILAK